MCQYSITNCLQIASQQYTLLRLDTPIVDLGRTGQAIRQLRSKLSL